VTIEKARDHILRVLARFSRAQELNHTTDELVFYGWLQSHLEDLLEFPRPDISMWRAGLMSLRNLDSSWELLGEGPAIIRR
jgi:hypothetical protein